MNELLLPIRGKQSSYLVDIDFDTAELGSREVIDKGSLRVTYTRSRKSGTDGDGVVDVPGRGRAYRFDGQSYFGTNKLLGVWNKAHQITAKLISDNANTTLFATGNYPSSGGIRSGFSFGCNQFPSQYAQLFMTNSGGTFSRVLLNAARPADGYDVIRVTRSATGAYTIESLLTGTKTSYAAPGAANAAESYYMLGGTHDLNSLFQGYLF